MGSHAIATLETVVLKDPKRAKELPLTICYPEQGGPYPVLVFSHGAGGSRSGYTRLSRYWASHGYVCIHPGHADSLDLRRSQGETNPTLTGLRVLLEDPKTWEARVKDVTLVLDSLGEIAATPQLKGKVDSARIGVAGHSFGAFTTMLVGGAKVDLSSGVRGKSYADPRPRAFLLLSPQGRGQQGLTETSWQGFTRPAMSMTGSLDRGVQGQGPEWRKDPYILSPPGEKYLVYLKGAGHASFSGATTTSALARRRGGLRGLPGGVGGTVRGPANPADAESILSAIQTAGLVFWNAYLKDDAKSRSYLKSEELSKQSRGIVQLSFK